MDLAFRTKRLARELAGTKAMTRAYGDRARPLMRRLDLLRQVRTLADVPAGSPDYCHQLGENRKGQFSVRIKDNWRLVFVPNHDPVPMLADGGIDLTKVTAIEIVEVVDYHGE